MKAKGSIRSLDDLKAEYWSIQATRDQLYWEQGRILIQIKEQLGHGKWEPWIEEHLELSDSQARARMRVGRLRALPKTAENRRFTLNELAAIGGIAERRGIAPDEAAQWFIDEQPKAEAAQIESARKTMARLEAFKVLGIDVENVTITAESLRILETGLRQTRHPDKGGTNDEFMLITEAVARLSERARIRSVSTRDPAQHNGVSL